MNLHETKQMLTSAISKYEKQSPPTLEELLLSFSTTPVYLYGAGAFGRKLLSLFTANGVAVHGFLDRNAQPGQTLCGVPVYLPDSTYITAEEREHSTLIVSIVLTLEERIPLFQTLNKLGFSKIIDGQSIEARRIPFSMYCNDTSWIDGELAAKICTVAELFADGPSREVYARNLLAHILRSYGDCAENIGCRQYFPKDIPFSKGYARFVDCGAYIGDTLTQLIKAINAVETYIGFEPDNDIFGRLADICVSLREKLPSAFLYPCAVGGSNRMASFAVQQGASTLSDSGEKMVQVVRLDNVLASFAPTFIKMDIEGAETEALQGAENMIREYHPDLAVCVYHNISDYFEIPLMLHRMNPGYRFYLRTHSSCTMETVLYATEEK